ncbi:MAG: hypothetical protein NTY20_03500, partial [Candidatus Aenigmarchaeota archaeon]|nr:hypothetical protein [Candidatus Aenigmarchaeota archaeon]
NFDYAIINEFEIPEGFQRIFQSKKTKPTPFGFGKIATIRRIENTLRHYNVLDSYFVFVLDRIIPEYQDHKAVHEYVELHTDDCRLALLKEFHTASLKGDNFLERYTKDWMEEHKDWLVVSPTEKKHHLNYLPSLSRQILKKGEFL